jgi:ABC-type multidrug transport system fused ATPase/permease subunit
MASPLGDRGIGLSGGERQRLALARAIVSDPRLLLLDEATSSLDTESERAFQDALSEIKGDVTILAIAHRLSTVVDADRIVVLEKGAMVEEGSPTDLLRNKNGRFSELYRLQSAAPLEDSSTGPTE